MAVKPVKYARLLFRVHELLRRGLTTMEEDGNSLYEAERLLAQKLNITPLFAKPTLKGLSN